jgi:hypothetical protein
MIKGAGGYALFPELKAMGGNSIRTWDTNDAQRILDEAGQLGLSVTLGIWITREREGFDYDDKIAVERQLEFIRRDIIKYKDHPALLMWNIGNEVYARSKNIRVWNFINRVAEMIHEIDPDHPTTTTVMNVPERIISLIRDRCPAIDILSINAYGAVFTLVEELRHSEWKGPYIISEFGNKGYWESPLTSWNQPVEQTTSEKIEFIARNYQMMLADEERFLGSYVFYWGYKPEKTHSWFSFFSEKQEKSPMVDMMSFLWQGKWPENRSPLILEFQINEQVAANGLIVEPLSENYATIKAEDPDNDPIYGYWEVLPELEDVDGVVVSIAKPVAISSGIIEYGFKGFSWKAPDQEGDYRLFVTVKDGNKNFSSANIPFRISETKNTEVSVRPNFSLFYAFFVSLVHI